MQGGWQHGHIKGVGTREDSHREAFAQKKIGTGSDSNYKMETALRACKLEHDRMRH